MMKTLQASLRVCSLVVLLPACASLPARAPYSREWGGFEGEFQVNTPEAKWVYSGAGSYVGDDGRVTPSREGGLRVVASGVNPSTGEPAFARTTGQEGSTGGPHGGTDHIKWLIYMNNKASSGQLGFDAIPGQELACETWISGRTYGTGLHPFGSAVTHHTDDLRLASFAQNTVDSETAMVFDFFFTNEQVYAFYERLPFARTPENHYASFSFMIPVAKRTPDSSHHVKIAYDRAAGIVRWVLDDHEVFRVNRVGRHIDRKYMALDHGGVEQDVDMRQLNCGMGMFTLLDFYLPSGAGLVRLSDASNNYFVPSSTEPVPLTFVDEKSKDSSRLFGQGAELRVTRYVVSSSPVKADP
ncbi:DUF6081 family protein [Stigmatella sp. ncwal1]|uniref:DUF6081 family protein n=1 Tax=Stigmatella ashevillensis TaxID=2995309 RepID=A0ABT5DNZ9_9BACT|nr:DUF6081 family protein [Stigmatella ashevillena]MDC0714789.1 DUF6081 family protein [Stigmatella ashevillena]